MYMHVYVHIYIWNYINIYIHMYMRIYICTYIYTYKHTYIYIHIHECIDIYIYIHAYIYIYLYIHIYIYTHICTYKHTYKCVHTHTHMYTHTCICHIIIAFGMRHSAHMISPSVFSVHPILYVHIYIRVTNYAHTSDKLHPRACIYMSHEPHPHIYLIRLRSRCTIEWGVSHL